MAEVKRYGPFIEIILREGEVVQQLTEIFRKSRIKTAIAISAVGFLENVELGFFTGEEYIRKAFDAPFELLGISGNFKDDTLHLHIILGNSEYKAIGGHLFRAKVGALFHGFFRILEENE